MVSEGVLSSPAYAWAVGALPFQIGVRAAPGETTLTLIFRGESSDAMNRAIARERALHRGSAASRGLRAPEIAEPFKMIEAPSLRCGAAACTVKNTEVILVRITDSNAASVVPPRGVCPGGGA